MENLREQVMINQFVQVTGATRWVIVNPTYYSVHIYSTILFILRIHILLYSVQMYYSILVTTVYTWTPLSQGAVSAHILLYTTVYKCTLPYPIYYSVNMYTSILLTTVYTWTPLLNTTVYTCTPLYYLP